MRRLVVFTKISCVCPDLVDLGGVDKWGALELEHEDRVAGQKHNVRAPSPLEWEFELKNDVPRSDVECPERRG